MPENPKTNLFPLIRNARLSGVKCRPGVSIRLEVNCEALPHFADLVVHLVREVSGKPDNFAFTFASGMHPAHIPGIDGHDDDVLEKNGGAEALSRVVSPRVVENAELYIERSFSLAIVTLEVKGSHDFRTSEFLDRLSRFLEPENVGDAPVPAPAESKTRATKKKADDSAEKTFRSRRRKAS